ncbi:MAG: DUF5916 domain-containing protein [Vicinamibacterales bacterium]|nr:DUF5916 domain-containing protein [Vicinamibacterales bacterium]MDP7690904.1 DUF5916 domain-containing protein [Vicinamibacterales bacterium]
MSRGRVGMLGVVLSLLAPPSVIAQLAPVPELARDTTAEGFPLARATRVEDGPAIDGQILTDPVWATVGPIGGFVQSTPDEGERASERTEIRVVYTDDTLYFGAILYDRDPATIVVADSRRDSSLDETDSFQIILDTFLDRQNGFVFGTSPSGLEFDGQVTNEGQGSGRFGGGGGGGRPGSGQQGGSGGGFNQNWDGAWQVDTRVTDVGWSAEFAIPFRTLRFNAGDVQVWGLNFQRNIRRRNETAYWSPLPRQFNLYRLSLAGQLTGLDVSSPRNLKVTPYVLGQGIDSASSRGDATYLGDVGADLKYSITPGLTLDATYNTDFAQVEVDEEQVNLDRFNLFFPEKRPFFLENAGIFSAGLPGQVEMFFSRRIGIGPDGQQVPILGGGRLSGKVGNNTNIGLLNMQTESIAGVAPANNFSVARVRQDFAGRSNIGVMFVNRQGTGSLALDDDYNRSYAVDGRWGIGQRGTISGFVGQTDTPGMQGQTHAYDLSSNYNSETMQLGLSYTEVAPQFNPEVGFYQRRAYRRANGRVLLTLRPDDLMGLHEVRPHVTHFTFWSFEGGLKETQFTHIDNHLEWRSGHEVHTGMNITSEGVIAPFEIFPGVVVPPGTYDHTEAQLVVRTNQGAPVSLEFRTLVGGFFGGDRVQLRPQLSMRAGEAFNAQLSWDRNDIELPGASFVTNLGRARVNYSFTPRMFVQALVQYNDRADLWSSNLRFGWLSDANTGLFVVYNDTQGIGDVMLNGAGRSLTVKYSLLMDMLN